MLSVYASVKLRSWFAFGYESSLRELKERPLHYLLPCYTIIIKEMLHAVRCLKSNEDMILAFA